MKEVDISSGIVFVGRGYALRIGLVPVSGIEFSELTLTHVGFRNDIERLVAFPVIHTGEFGGIAQFVIDLDPIDGLGRQGLDCGGNIFAEKLLAIDKDLLDGLTLCLDLAVRYGNAGHFLEQPLHVGIGRHLESIGIIADGISLLRGSERLYLFYDSIDLHSLLAKFDPAVKYAAIAFCGPFGAVKEQASGLYAQELAARGFVALAFDPSYTGESSGEPRYVASPDINTEDFSAAVDCLSLLPYVNPERIGILGICGWGGMALNAAANDTRIKGTVAVTMYDMSRVSANGYFDSMDANGRYELRRQLNAQRLIDAKNGTFETAGGVPDVLPENAPQFVKDYFAYYKTPRGYHARSLNSNRGWNKTSTLSFLNTPLLVYSSEIRSACLLIHGEKAHSRYFSEDAFKKLTGSNKELMIVPGASHVDLYDNFEKIPFDRIEGFFQSALK